MEPPAISQQTSILALSQRLEGTMLTGDQSRPMQFSITGGQGGPGGEGYSHGTGGAGGTGMGPTFHITAQEFNLHAMQSSEPISQVSQESKLRAAQMSIKCPLPSRKFQGRKDILDKMQDFFALNIGTQNIYVLHGLGGAGKTQIALKFITDSGSRFSDVFFIDTSTSATIDTGLVNIAIVKGFGNSQQDGLLWLTSNIKEWLLFFDNADDPDIDLNEFIPQCDHGNIIITSRNPGLCVYAGTDSLVSDMEEADAVTLLLKRATQKITAATIQIATEIVKALCYLPLAIVQAGAFISKSRNLGNYLELYEKNQAQLLSEKPAQSQDHYKWTVFTTWQMSFDQLTPQAATLLQHCLFLHHTGISQEIFRYASEYRFPSNGPSKEDLHDPLELLSHFVGPTGEWDSLQFTIAMNDIQAFSLISFDEETKLFSIHPLVHAWGRATIPHADRCITTIGAILGMTISKRPEWDSVLPSLVLYPHIEMAVQTGTHPALFFRYCYGILFWEAGKYKQSVKMLEAVLEEEKQLLGDEHSDVLDTMESLSRTYSALGEYQQAKALQITVLEKQKEIVGNNHLDTLHAMVNLARIYSELGEYQHAKALDVTVLEKRKQILGDSHPLTLRAMGNLAATYSDLGEYQKAKDLEIVVLEKQKQIMGDNHPDTLRAMINLARTYSDFGEYQEAKHFEIAVLEKRKKILGKNHPGTLLAMGNLAATYSKLGEYQKAKDLEIVVLEEQKQILGCNHPDTLLAMGNLARTYSEFGAHKEAKDLEIAVLEKREHILGNNHPDTLLAMRNLARTYSNLGEHKKAKDLEIALFEKQKQILGNDHPDTLFAMSNLATTYWYLKDYQNAKELEIIVFEKQKQILGDTHPDTLRAMSNLAFTYSDLGEHQKAQELRDLVHQAETASNSA
ncbi:FabD/lysophospholipase-like protein [Mycena sanguinolenta]|uniref:FabD/lysophospholipase-like protein n=1 Tax=Mycena sanguinolenta TaxID=230812 RepID=A0A8H6Z0D0_9AGAR|nr:FabD/lysophospholipase-like protein [Mycena sanguinolenta]